MYNVGEWLVIKRNENTRHIWSKMMVHGKVKATIPGAVLLFFGSSAEAWVSVDDVYRADDKRR